MTDATAKKRFAMPRELRIIFSAGCLVFVLMYLVVPQFANARKVHPLHPVSYTHLLRKKGVSSAVLFVDQSNTIASKLYESLGFVVEREDNLVRFTAAT